MEFESNVRNHKTIQPVNTLVYFKTRHVYSSVVSSAPSILQHRVQITRTLSIVFSIYSVEIGPKFALGMRKGRKLAKRGQDLPILKDIFLRV